MHTDELRREIVAMADDLEPFAGDAQTLYRQQRRRRVITSVIAIAVAAGLATVGAAVARSHHDALVRVSSAPSKEVAASKITHIDAIVVPATETVKLALDQSKLVAGYSLVPRMQPPDVPLRPKSWRSALCALRSSDGYGVRGTGDGTNLAAALRNAIGSNATVYALGDRFGVTDAEIFMKVDATPRETAALRTTLAHDPDIASFRYISTTDAYEIFKSEFSDQPELVQGTKLGDLPQSFRLNVALGRSVEKVADRYRIDAGVDTVIQQEPMTFLKPPKGSGAPPTPCTGS